MNKIAIIAMCLLASACTNRAITPVRTEYKMVDVDESYFVCNKVPLPDPETLTDVQIAALINDLVKENRTCYNNSQGLKKYLETAKKILEDRK